MRRTVLALGCMTALLVSCAAGDGRTWVRGGAPATYRQEVGAAARPFSAQQHASTATSEPGLQRVILTRQALLGAVSDVERLTRDTADPLRQLAANKQGLSGRANGVFNRYIAYGSKQLPWIQGALGGVTTLADVAWKVDEPDMGLALLRISGLPELMGQLTREFQSIRQGARVATERAGQMMAAAQFVEMLTMVSMMKISLPRLPPAAPTRLGMGLVMGSSGIMMGSQLIVTAEWVEMMRRLVQAGVLSVSAVSAAVRIHAGQVMMAQANQGLPQGVRDALGEGPEVSAMHETGKTGAGMAERPQHHVLPDEFRRWFEKRGFTGAMSIDQFCVELELAHHQAIHGGGNWRLGRAWPNEWNQMIMKTLRDAEVEAGRLLTRNEILNIVAESMRDYSIPMRFTRWRGR
ncbi:MAG: DUF2380 domain-containing protein [Myxococcaceae bacterium]|nr:DUF2380 domain-containing protein [Myxococcaceae bacterium]